ncbi:MAG: hypothetical protein K6T90_08660 [Leptolyngbyaceae cyanobacterium HOT.MB2.61]|nr:hypothetical protein [Leptolyngbyaceae cyanobacterium HOT.MB2.61]
MGARSQLPFLDFACEALLKESLYIENFGATGMGAFNRILGFLILAIAVQLIVDSV